MRAKMSTNGKRGVAVPAAWGDRGPECWRGYVWLPEGPPDADAALSEARAILAETEPRGDSSRGYVPVALLVSARQAHRDGASMHGAMVEALAAFIVDGPGGAGC